MTTLKSAEVIGQSSAKKAARGRAAKSEPTVQKRKVTRPSGTTGTFSPEPWAALGLSGALLDALRRVDFQTPTDIQRELIPAALAGRDVLGQAKTGTGKTAAFSLPTLQRLELGGGMQALILVPTRELARQVEEHVLTLGQELGVKTVAILGGTRIRQQLTALRANPEVVVGTPGRVQDLHQRGELSFDRVRMVVLDEVDRMLDIGFRDDIRRILKTINNEHQTLFVSATIDDEIRRLARTYMREPLELNVSKDEELTVAHIHQGYVSVDPHDKFDTLLRFLEHENPTLAIVFTNTKHQARRVAQNLKKHDVNCREIHGDLVQAKRDSVMKSFREGRIHVLVATDLAARGLDVLEVSHVVNYDVPVDTAIYVHRVGRTARMGNAGYAVTFVTRDQTQGKLLTDIEKLINRELPRFEPTWVVQRNQPRPVAEVNGAPAAAEGTATAAAAAPSQPDGPIVPQRYKDVIRRCDILDQHGIKPLRRTLGSRFRSPRRR